MDIDHSSIEKSSTGVNLYHDSPRVITRIKNEKIVAAVNYRLSGHFISIIQSLALKTEISGTRLNLYYESF